MARVKGVLWYERRKEYGRHESRKEYWRYERRKNYRR